MALQESESTFPGAFLNRHLRESPFTRAGRILDANLAATEMFGYEQTEIHGLKCQ